MGKINKISIKNFRNFENYNISFSENCNIFFGHNGSGKTNILESLSLVSKGRGFRSASILSLMHKNINDFEINIDYELEKNLYKLKIYNQKINSIYKKIISVNDEVSKDASEFIENSISFLFIYL